MQISSCETQFFNNLNFIAQKCNYDSRKNITFDEAKNFFAQLTKLLKSSKAELRRNDIISNISKQNSSNICDVLISIFNNKNVLLSKEIGIIMLFENLNYVANNKRPPLNLATYDMNLQIGNRVYEEIIVPTFSPFNKKTGKKLNKFFSIVQEYNNNKKYLDNA